MRQSKRQQNAQRMSLFPQRTTTVKRAHDVGECQASGPMCYGRLQGMHTAVISNAEFILTRPSSAVSSSAGGGILQRWMTPRRTCPSAMSRSLQCHFVVPISTSSFSVSLSSLRLTFTHTPMHKILTTREHVLPSRWPWLECTACLSRAGIWTPQNIHYSAIHFICFI